MAKSLPPLTWFRSFEASARHLNFTLAADDIGLTQSAVSQQVKSLEQRLGVMLFIRRARGLSLTDEGRRLLPQVATALETLENAARSFDTGGVENLLTISTSVSVAQWVIAPHLAEFTAAHPQVRVRLLSAIWPDDFQSARADVEIRFGQSKQAGREAKLLRPAELVPLRSPDMRGALADLPLIEAVGTSGGWSAWAEAHGNVGKPTVFADTYGMALQLAAQGNGVALVSALLAGHAIEAGTLERAHSGSIPAQEGYYLSVDPTNPAAVAFGDWLIGLLYADAPGV